MVKQLFFDLDFSPLPEPVQGGKSAGRGKRRLLQRAVLCWLEGKEAPTGVALEVITRISRLRADVAGFWSIPVKNTHKEGPPQILTPAKTMIIQCHAEREECWPDCIRSREILPQLRALKSDLAEAEKQIRSAEPELREDNTLFEEYAEWHYEDSQNRQYHHVKRAIEKMEHGLYHGTKFERIRSVQLADYLYLAVPVGVVEKTELADGWGLLWVDDDLNVEIVAEPEKRDCLPTNRVHLVQNIAAAAKASELTVHGVLRKKNSKPILTRPVRRHRAAQNLRLSDI